jgi:gluconate kinase
MEQRSGHFFSAELLHSQFAILEEPVQAITVSVSGTPEQIVRVIIDKLKAGGKRAHK